MEHESKEERWIWVGFASEHRLILATYAGPMTQEAANKIVNQIGERINEDKLPLFVSDGRKFYKQALLNRYGYIREPFPRTGKRGRPRKLIRVPFSDLRYAQIVKTRKGNKIIKITKRILYGEEKDIPESEINTSYIERQNLTTRQDNNRLARKTLGYSKKDEWQQYQATLQMTTHNFVRPHESLRIFKPEQIRGKVWRKYKKQTPMMSARITDHIWTLKELLTYPYHQKTNP